MPNKVLCFLEYLFTLLPNCQVRSIKHELCLSWSHLPNVQAVSWGMFQIKNYT